MICGKNEKENREVSNCTWCLCYVLYCGTMQKCDKSCIQMYPLQFAKETVYCFTCSFFGGQRQPDTFVTCHLASRFNTCAMETPAQSLKAPRSFECERWFHFLTMESHIINYWRTGQVLSVKEKNLASCYKPPMCCFLQLLHSDRWQKMGNTVKKGVYSTLFIITLHLP